MTVQALKLILEEIKKLRATEVTDDELREAKEIAVNRLAFDVDTKDKILNQILAADFYGYPADFVTQHQKTLAAVTKADVLRVAKEHLIPEQFTVVVVGSPGDFVPSLTDLGKVTAISMKAPEAPKLEAAKVDAASLEKGKQLLARMQQAVGGVDKLTAVKDFKMVSTYDLTQQGRLVPVKQTEMWIAPDMYRSEVELAGGTIISFCQQDHAWVTVPGGSAPVAGPQLKQVQGNVFRLYIPLLLSDHVSGGRVNALDDETVEISANGQVVRLKMDTATGLPNKLRYEVAAATGSGPLIEETFDDFRDVAGIKVPFRSLVTQSGTAYADSKTAEFKMNIGLKAADLEKRP